MKSFACRRQHLSLWLSYLVVFSLRLRRSRKWRSVIHWTAPQTTALRTTKPTSTNWWSTVRLASRREPLWSVVANRCSDQVRQRYLHRRLEVKRVSGINQSAWSTSDMTDDALWLVLSAFQVFSLNPPCSSMSKTTCTSLKRSRSAPSWSFPSSRAGNASSRLYPFCHIYSSTQKMKNNITEASFFPLCCFSLLPCLPSVSVPQRGGRCSEEGQCYRVRPGIRRFHTGHQQSSVRQWKAQRRHCFRQHLQQDWCGGAFRRLQTIWLWQRPR